MSPGAAAQSAKNYDPSDYAPLSVPSEISDLFDYITRFEARDLELDTQLSPFVPDFLPAIGEIDPFVKVAHFTLIIHCPSYNTNLQRFQRPSCLLVLRKWILLC